MHEAPGDRPGIGTASGTEPAPSGVRIGRPAIGFIAAWLVVPGLLCAAVQQPPVAHRGSRIPKDSFPPSRFFTDPPASRFFTDPPPPSRFFTDPPRSSWFTNPPASRFFTDPPRSSWFARAGHARSAPTTYDDLIREIAASQGVEYALVKAMIQAESDFDRFAVSPKGARGLMQLMPATASLEGVRNVFTPQENIEGGSRYLRSLLDHYGGSVSLAVAAYNAGPERVDAAGGVPPIAETQMYLSRVLQYRLDYLRQH